MMDGIDLMSIKSKLDGAIVHTGRIKITKYLICNPCPGVSEYKNPGVYINV